MLCALAQGDSTLTAPLHSDDTEAMIDCLRGLGVTIESDDGEIRISATGALHGNGAVLNARGSGTSARFVTAAATLAQGRVEIDGNARMRERPIADLVDALRQLGANLVVNGENGCPPVSVQGTGLRGGTVSIDASRSSQYVSAVMMVAPYAAAPVTLSLIGPVVSRPYLQSTLDVMRAFGVAADMHDDAISVPRGRYSAREYLVEPDASAAAYPWAAAAITGGEVTIRGIAENTSQADIGLLDVLQKMGCDVRIRNESITVSGPRELQCVDVDMNHCPDAVLAAAVVAAHARGPTTIRNVGNLRIKETDRLAALESELCRIGHDASTGDDWLCVVPGEAKAATVKTYDDHRMAMSFALAGLVTPGITIDDPGCVAKTWPGFFTELERW